MLARSSVSSSRSAIDVSSQEVSIPSVSTEKELIRDGGGGRDSAAADPHGVRSNGDGPQALGDRDLHPLVELALDVVDLRQIEAQGSDRAHLRGHAPNAHRAGSHLDALDTVAVGGTWSADRGQRHR